MIDRVRIQGFRAHADTQLELGRFTVLVGDNASGKTSVLEALRVLGILAAPAGIAAFPDHLQPGDLFARDHDPAITFDASCRTGDGWQLTARVFERDVPLYTLTGAQIRWALELQGQVGKAGFERKMALWSGGGANADPEVSDVLPSTIGVVATYNLRADQIAAASYSDEADVRVGFDGSHTSVVLAAMKLNDDQNFDRIVASTRRMIPSVERIRLGRADVKNGHGRVGNKIVFDFRGAPNIPAHAASHGTLIVLALMTILHSPNRPSLILLDDLDHALHPRAQMELMKLLQEILALPEFAEVQIVATTHSPYVLDMIDPANIYAFAMRDDGASVSKRLSEHPDAAKSKGLSAGQLWSLDAERKWVLRNAS